MPDSGEHLPARQDQFDRTTNAPRRQNAQDFVRPDADALGAKAAAGEVTNDAHPFFGHLEDDRQQTLGPRHALAGQVGRQVVALPTGEDRVRLDGMVMLGGRAVSRLDYARVIGPGQGRVGRAARGLGGFVSHLFGTADVVGVI